MTPHHEGESEHQERLIAETHQELARCIDIESEILVEAIRVMATEVHHSGHPGAPRAERVAVAEQSGAVDDEHRQPLRTEHLAQHARERLRLHRRGVTIEIDPTHLLAGRSTRGEHLEHIGCRNTLQLVLLEEPRRQERKILYARVLAPGSLTDGVEDPRVGRAAFPMELLELDKRRQQRCLLLRLTQAEGRNREEIAEAHSSSCSTE